MTKQLAAIDRVGDGSANERHDEQRHHLHQTEGAYGERRPGDNEHLVGHGDHGELTAEKGEQVTEEEPSEFRRHPQRGDVDDDLPTECALFLGWVGHCTTLPRTAKRNTTPVSPTKIALIPNAQP